MTDDSSLQIDIRCIKCGCYPSIDNRLLEMQNFRYICNRCCQVAEQEGKRISWSHNTLPQTPSPAATTTVPLKKRDGNGATSKLPADSLFATLNISLTAPSDEIKKAIRESMRRVMREEESSERTKTIEQLREWQNMVEDHQALSEYINALQPTRQKNTLSVGGRLTYTAQEFLEACEASAEGWADGERYLRSGKLQHWAIFQLGNGNLGKTIRHYQQMNISDSRALFRAFNAVLYSLVPERPFRFYEHDEWQPLHTLSSASTPEELADLCDLHWELGEHHLYAGSLGFWLERSHNIKGLYDYYKTAVAGYERAGTDRGVGLELLLERALPTLEKPKLIVTFDDMAGHWETPQRWDREIPHQPINVKVTNTTRGFSSIIMVLEPSPKQSFSQAWGDWMVLKNSPLHISVLRVPASKASYTATILLPQLSRLKRWHTYHRTLTLFIKKEYGQEPEEQQFPLTFKTMRFFDGLRGILWRFGLRGGFAGLIWHFAASFVLAYVFFLLITALIPTASIQQTLSSFSQTSNFSSGMVIQALIGGISEAIRTRFHGIGFPLVTGGLLGVIGFGVGYRQGHASYSASQGALTFFKRACWATLVFTALLITWNQVQGDGASTFVNALQGNRGDILQAVLFVGGDILLGLLLLIIVRLIAFLRYQVEQNLRERYKNLLNPQGRA